MTDKPKRTKLKRLPQGWRKHIRRLKQAARKEGISFRRPVYARPPDKADAAQAKSHAESTTKKEAE